MHDIHVSVTSPEAADHGVAEFWAGRELVGFTLLEDSDLMLHIEPRPDGGAVVLGAHSLAGALRRAHRLLGSQGRPENLGPDPEPLGSDRFERIVARGFVS